LILGLAPAKKQKHFNFDLKTGEYIYSPCGLPDEDLPKAQLRVATYCLLEGERAQSGL